MTSEKFVNDTATVLKFVQIYCDDKHKDMPKKRASKDLVYNDQELGESLEYHLCATCENTFNISYEKLQECPHEEKPSCRKCPAPCYDKPDWKTVAQIMKYSGMKLGLNRVRKLFRRS